MRMKVRFILNPKSGGGRRSESYRLAIADFMAAHRIDGDIAVTVAPGHATELAEEAVVAGFSHVACVGGDGTLNEVAQALLQGHVILVVIPNGSGNGLARHLNIPLSLSDSLALLVSKEAAVASIDTGAINGRLFCNVAGVGFDADVAAAFNGMTRRGLSGYVRVALRLWVKRKPTRYRIESETGSVRVEALFIAVANSDQYGNNARIAPGASVEDGMLDLVAVPNLPWWRLLPLLGRLFLGGIDRYPRVRRFTGSRFTIVRTEPAAIHTDGEVHVEGQSLEIETRSKSLRVLRPPIHSAQAHRSSSGGAVHQVNALLSVIACAGFVIFLLSALTWMLGSGLVDLDRSIAAFASAHRTASGVDFMEAVSILGSFPFVGFVVLCMATLFVGTGRFGALVALLVAVPGGTLLNVALKWAFHRPRPLGETVTATISEYSFPSGHTSAATLLFGVLAIFAVPEITGIIPRILVVGMAISLVISVAISRVYLGVHHTTDVLAAMGLYTSWLWVSVRSGALADRRRTTTS